MSANILPLPGIAPDLVTGQAHTGAFFSPSPFTRYDIAEEILNATETVILLIAPPGSGKRAIAEAVTRKLGRNTHEVDRSGNPKFKVLKLVPEDDLAIETFNRDLANGNRFLLIADALDLAWACNLSTIDSKVIGPKQLFFNETSLNTLFRRSSDAQFRKSREAMAYTWGWPLPTLLCCSDDHKTLSDAALNRLRLSVLRKIRPYQNAPSTGSASGLDIDPDELKILTDLGGALSGLASVDKARVRIAPILLDSKFPQHATTPRERRKTWDGIDLTPKESVILCKLDSGDALSSIAEKSGVKLSTLKWHLKQIYSKMDVRNRSGAVARAREIGLTQSMLRPST